MNETHDAGHALPGRGGLRYLSVCSGIEAATVAWAPLGWQCAGVSEIEPFPRAVLQQRLGAVPVEFDDHRWTEGSNITPLFGDFTQIQEHHVGPIDLLVGGTPCQSFSVAGKRLGLDDPRGNLTLEFLALARRLQPRWLVWENVPGVLSHDRGRTFGTFLALLAECGFERWAYRVLDAQYCRVGRFGRAVPQRRRRVFVVGYSGTDDIHPRAVLFDRESLRRNPAPRRETGQGIAPTLAARTRGGGGLGADFDCDGGLIAADVAPTLNAHFGEKQGLEDQHINGKGWRGDGAAYTIEACSVPQAVAFAEISRSEIRLCGGDGHVSPQLTTGGGKPGQGQPCIAKDYGADAMADCSPTLRAGGHAASHANAGVMPAVAFDMRGREGGSQLEGPHDTANIRAASGGSSRSYVAHRWGVRRLTPTECSRLQGFHDDHAKIAWRGKPADQCPDGPQYKAYGNSMAVNVMSWIGERIAAVDSLREGLDLL
jgi:DNA (cytosine-5)-methyltransferase 1